MTPASPRDRVPRDQREREPHRAPGPAGTGPRVRAPARVLPDPSAQAMARGRTTSVGPRRARHRGPVLLVARGRGRGGRRPRRAHRHADEHPALPSASARSSSSWTASARGRSCWAAAGSPTTPTARCGTRWSGTARRGRRVARRAAARRPARGGDRERRRRGGPRARPARAGLPRVRRAGRAVEPPHRRGPRAGLHRRARRAGVPVPAEAVVECAFTRDGGHGGMRDLLARVGAAGPDGAPAPSSR